MSLQNLAQKQVENEEYDRYELGKANDALQMDPFASTHQNKVDKCRESLLKFEQLMS